MKRWLLRTLVLLLVGLFVLGIRYELKKQAQKRREAGYQSQLLSYSLALTPGMKRKEVEGYLRARNVSFSQDLVDLSDQTRRHSQDDLVKIGDDDHPWFCSEYLVYVAFRFADHEPLAEEKFYYKNDDLDTLKAISIYRRLGGCL